ncbi:hypothetical protein, partial [Ectothiorhodospira haloalkaliphila]|uniref:hypothetical protein n=1 Tax=Ectothiorhodospira haloalkaliphila TaxID=421628 RepID=UPI003AF9F093
AVSARSSHSSSPKMRAPAASAAMAWPEVWAQVVRSIRDIAGARNWIGQFVAMASSAGTA